MYGKYMFNFISYFYGPFHLMFLFCFTFWAFQKISNDKKFSSLKKHRLTTDREKQSAKRRLTDTEKKRAVTSGEREGEGARQGRQ